ncbi:hypothetical protein SAMN03097699_0533 [Flavobacteriaceae bacterium MAR_2010_188]|nr:hypothetical protein SAMN03097699_0533 [Flavobacteriaceae bacterium MAR_2010_188]
MLWLKKYDICHAGFIQGEIGMDSESEDEVTIIKPDM